MEEKKEAIKNVTELTEKIKLEKEKAEEADISTPPSESESGLPHSEPSHEADCRCKTCKDNEKEMAKLMIKQKGIFKQNRNLKKSRYGEQMNKWDTAYVLKNKKTELIVEIRAASSYHACNMLGWKPQQSILLETINVKEREEKQKAKELSESSTAVVNEAK